MATILVTGPGGFLGAPLVAHLLTQGHEVIGLGRTAPPSGSSTSYTHLSGTVGEVTARLQSVPEDAPRADVVLHLAWAGSGGPARDDSALQLLNVQEALAAVTLTSLVGASRFVGVGTITELELEQDGFSHGAPGPGFVYGAAKRAAKDLTHYYASKAGVAHTWVHMGNTYAPGDTTGRFFISTLEKMAAGDQVINLSSGTQDFDFVFIEDALRALEAVVLEGRDNRTYYVGSGEPRPLKEFLLKMAEETQTTATLNFGAPSVGAVALPLEVFSISPLMEDTSYRPQVSFEEGVQRVLDSLK